jgi:hypothetical protein
MNPIHKFRATQGKMRGEMRGEMQGKVRCAGQGEARRGEANSAISRNSSQARSSLSPAGSSAGWPHVNAAASVELAYSRRPMSKRSAPHAAHAPAKMKAVGRSVPCVEAGTVCGRVAAAAAASDDNTVIDIGAATTVAFAVSRFLLRLDCERDGLVGVELMHVIVLTSTACDAKQQTHTHTHGLHTRSGICGH